MADHGKRQQTAQVGLLEGQRSREENARHGKADHVRLPGRHRCRCQWQDKTQHAENTDLDADHQCRRNRDQAMLGHVRQPAMQRKQRRAHRQPVEQQVKRGRLELAFRQRAGEIEQIEAPAPTGRLGMPPPENDTSSSKHQPAKSLILDEARQCLDFRPRRRPAPQQINHRPQFKQRKNGEPGNIQRHQHANETGLGNQQHCKQPAR